MENKNLNQEELNELMQDQDYDCGETIEDGLLQLTIEKECDRLSRLFLFNESVIEKLTKRKEFDEGVKEGLKICGLYSTLVSFGMDETNIMDIILNKMNIDHNILTTKISNEASIEVSKNQALQVEKNSL